jgi:hypothetical protein
VVLGGGSVQGRCAQVPGGVVACPGELFSPPPVLPRPAPCEARGSRALSDGAMPPLFAAVGVASRCSLERVIRVLGKRPSDSKGSRLGAATWMLPWASENPCYH